MPYIPIKLNRGIQLKDLNIKTTNFKSLNIKESDIEEFIRKNIGEVFGEEETLLIVGKQVHNEAKGIIDLIALDKNGYLVLIEIKRDVNDLKSRREPFEFQAIRYAASCAKMATTEDLVDNVFVDYIEKHKEEFDLEHLTLRERASKNLNDFLEKNESLNTFNQKQRIILISSSFDKQTNSAVAWLISNGVDITTYTFAPIILGNEYFLNVEKVLPPAYIRDFLIDIPGRPFKNPTSNKSQYVRTNLPRINMLFEWKIIKKGDKLSIRNFDDSKATVVDDRFVKFKGETIKYNEWGLKVTGWSSICIYEWAILESKGETLFKLRAKKMKELTNDSSKKI